MLHQQPIHNIFFSAATATTKIYTLSLHDALPIYGATLIPSAGSPFIEVTGEGSLVAGGPLLELNGILHLEQDRKSTRLNSSHQISSYAVFCLKKKISGARWR